MTYTFVGNLRRDQTADAPPLILRIELELYEAQTTHDLRNAIHKATGVPPERQQILGLKGGVLRTDGPLGSYNIYEGQKIVLMEMKAPPSTATALPVAAPVAAAIAKVAARRPPRGAVVATNMTECLNFMELPGELQSMVISFLLPTEVAATASVSKNWRGLVDDELLWREYFTHRYRDPHASVPPASWKALYARRYRSGTKPLQSIELHLELNARAARCLRVQLPMRGQANCICMMKPESETVFVGNLREIIQFELPSTKFPEGCKLRTLKGQQENITAMCRQQDCLISGGDSGNLMLWDTKKDPTPLPWHRRSVEYIGTLRGHQATITELILDENITTLITASLDGVILVHDLHSGAVKHRFVAEEAGSVEGLALSGNRLISVHDRRKIYTWNVNGASEEPISTHSYPVQNVGAYVGTHYCAALELLTIAAEGAVEVWDTKLWRIQQVIRQNHVVSVCNDGRFLWMGCNNGVYLHYDGQVIPLDQTLGNVMSLYFRGDFLLAATNLGLHYYDFTKKPPPAPAAAQRAPVFSDEAENDAPDEMPNPAHHGLPHGGNDNDDDMDD